MCINVRDLTIKEGRRLQQFLPRANTRVITAGRAEIVRASAQGMNVPEIARTYYCSEDHVRTVIHRVQPGRPGVVEALVWWQATTYLYA